MHSVRRENHRWRSSVIKHKHAKIGSESKRERERKNTIDTAMADLPYAYRIEICITLSQDCQPEPRSLMVHA